MSLSLDRNLKETGTRFLVYPQFPFKGNLPETVVVSLMPSEIKPGPADNRMYVVDALKKTHPYNSDINYKPPYQGVTRKPVQPGPDGHYDTLKPGNRDFNCAAMYATIKRVLDIWEDYFKSPVQWHFETEYDKLELIPMAGFFYAYSGWGYLEFGYPPAVNENTIDPNIPFCLHFDVLAHELGHAIIHSKVGRHKKCTDETIDYEAMDESSADLVAIISVLHFDSVVNSLLNETKGNLFTINELDRIGELSENTQMRLAFNNCKMSDVDNDAHFRSQPLTGAIFDVLVEIFQNKLLSENLISRDLADRSVNSLNFKTDIVTISRDFNTAYTGMEKEFRQQLLESRDIVGLLLAESWDNLTADGLNYYDVLIALFNADRKINNGKHLNVIRECFEWREIGPPVGSSIFKARAITGSNEKECAENPLKSRQLKTKNMINNHLFYAFHQGMVQSKSEVAGNCASVALIKAAIDAFGIGNVFAVSDIAGGKSITLKNNQVLTLTNAEIEMAADASAFVLGTDVDNAAEEALFRQIFDYANLCFAVIVKHVHVSGEMFSMTDIVQYQTFEDALENVNDGLYAPLCYHYLGLESHIKNMGVFSSTSGLKAIVSWSAGHVVYTKDGFYDDHGVRRRMKLKYYDRFMVI